MLSIEEAVGRVLELVAPLPAEQVSLDDALGRVLAADVRTSRALPGFDNSAMDGYAVHAGDIEAASHEAPVALPLAGVIGAGRRDPQTLARGTALRIFTGAPVPAGADAVVMQEDTDADASGVHIHKAVSAGANIRRAGEDMRAGELLLPSGVALGPGDIGALAAQGVARLSVVRRPRVAIVPTGDELVGIEQLPGPFEVPNSNAHLLAAQVRACGGVPLVAPIAPDERGAVEAALRGAAAEADLVLTSGGVSVGDFDFVRGVVTERGGLDFWKVAMKPGKPLCVGRCFDTAFIGLPGNPVSTFVTFALFGAPAVRRLAGHVQPTLPRRRARLAQALRPDRSRRELVRGRTIYVDGELTVEPVARRGSHQLSSLVQVDALLDVPPGPAELPPGTLVEIVAV